MENMTAGIKRKRADDYSQTKQLVLEELDLELALKDRVANTLQSRITWALLLQESLEKDLNASSDANFRNIALDTLDAIDTPCALILERESAFDTDLDLDGEVPVSNQSSERSARTYSARNRVAQISQPTHKVLFVRNNTPTSVLVARLQCPDCARWDFSTIQGFLNHCRIRHQRDYGGHDECIQHCSVLVPEEEREWVVENGTEISGVGIPSLRRLFEMAVSGKNSSIFPNYHLASSTAPEESPQIAEDTTTTHLSRTLGLHKDTPALAPFLGKKVQRRCINVFEQDQEVDIDSTASEPKILWRMPFSHRSFARAGLDETFDQLSLEFESPLPKNDHVSQNDSIQQNSSRFHMSARILVTDRSRWLPPGKRPSAHPDHTHGWILSIDSPSYSLHVTTILASATVSSLTDPPPSTLLHPIVITEPPFVVASTTDRPFLAQISLVWNGSENSPMDIEHWVEVDHMKSGYQILGMEQVFDIELDRNTEVAPRSESVKRRNPTFPETSPASDRERNR